MKTLSFITLAAVALTLNLNGLKANNFEMELGKATKSDSQALFLASLNVVEEETIEISDWMFDDEAFESDIKMVEIEDWMLEIDAFEEPKVLVEEWILDDYFLEEYEEVVEIEEDWMFNVEDFLSENEKYEEELIELSDWMFDVDAFLAK